MATSRPNRWAKLVLTMIVVLGVAIPVLMLLQQSNKAADYSAHAALTAEICSKLGSFVKDARFPASLSDLQLTYPDGGNTSLLSRFSYHSSGTNCTLSTVLRGQEILRAFP